MKYSKAEAGRVFVIRLEDGEVIHEEIEKLAREEAIRAGSMIMVGGADEGSKLVVGPVNGRATSISPMEHKLENVHEVLGAGTLFPDQQGEPLLHMHIACGRQDSTVTGCVRRGVKAWQVLELILYELVNTNAARVPDPELGFALLDPGA